jgi:hypothetical protein
VGPGGGRGLRILVGAAEIAGQLPVYADGFRRLGHRVTTVVHSRNDFYPDLEYDFEIRPKIIAWPDAVRRSSSPPVRLARGGVNRLWAAADSSSRSALLLRLMARHDLFVFQWAGLSLWQGNREYPFLKKIGKRIVAICNGDDVRHWSSYDQQHAAVGMREINLRGYGDFYQNDPLSRPLRNLRMAERYADLVLSVPNQSGLAVRPYARFYYPLNLSQYSYEVPGREVPVVVHAPSAKSIKGTQAIESTLDRLRSEGVPFEFRLLHGVPNAQVLTALAAADVAVEQLPIPSYGRLGAEAMASGCALATCSREEFEPIPPGRPIWHIDYENLYDRLKTLLTDRELRMRLAREGRQYVEKYHDHVGIARQVLAHLGGGAEYDYYPSFFAKRYGLPHGEVVPPDLKRMTAQVVRRWGLPEGVEPEDLVARGLMSADGLGPPPIPRWAASPSAAT